MKKIALKFNIIAVLIFSGTCLAGCKKEKIPLVVNCDAPTSSVSIAKQLILGKWIWQYEAYRPMYPPGTLFIKDPSNQGYTQSYYFKNGEEVYYYRNDTFIQKNLYKITTLNAITNYEPDTLISVLIFEDEETGKRIDFAPIRICNDTLSLNYQFYSDTKGMEKWSKE